MKLGFPKVSFGTEPICKNNIQFISYGSCVLWTLSMWFNLIQMPDQLVPPTNPPTWLLFYYHQIVQHKVAWCKMFCYLHYFNYIHSTITSTLVNIISFNATCQLVLFEGIQCPTCEGETEDDCNNKTEMVACPIEAPICAVYISISPEFICKCVDYAEFHTVLNECKNDDYCKMAKYGTSKSAAYVKTSTDLSIVYSPYGN